MPQRDAIDYVERAKTQVNAAIEAAPTQGTHKELVDIQAELDELHGELKEVN